MSAGTRPSEGRAAVRPPLPRWQGVAALLLIATGFASNHIAARLAFEHGTTVATAVVVRSTVTVLTTLGLLAATRTALALPGRTVGRAVVIGLLLSVQSYCLYGAVARLPVALALLTFNVFPILLAALSWASGGERPSGRTLIAMPVILAGLVLALNVLGIGLPETGGASPLERRFAELAGGVGFALTGSLAFACVLLLTTRWLAHVDGRLRTCLTMATVAVVVLAVGLAVDAAGLAVDGAGRPQAVFGLPQAPAGWLGLALLSILYTAAFVSLFVLLPRLGAINNTPILNFEPIAAMGLGVLILDQRVLAIQVLGALLVVGGIIFLATGRRPLDGARARDDERR